MGARFLRLGIAGFKSFADAATLEILPGLTGVVGPNGCGKSNVAEALRWAMGEANARHLRGGEMDDVIFAGTANRASRNLAEVSIHLESDPSGLPPPFADQAELQVVRRIERGGGSAYRVNGRDARARDVQTLFADLGSGARASGMVSQGRVGTLVNARPEERRAVLEEAAGITGLHARRAEAETRLRATEANLERAGERRTLLESQLAGLRAQARQAARYRTVSEAVGEAEALVLAIGRSRAEQGRGVAAVAERDAQDRVQAATVATIAAAQAANVTQAALPGLRNTESAARAALERARLAGDVVAADLLRAEETLRAADGRRTQLRRDQAHADAVLQDAEAADARLVIEAHRLQIETAAHPAQLAAARERAETAAAALRAADTAAATAAAAAAEVQAMEGALRQVLREAEGRARRAQEAAARLEAEQARAAAQTVDPARLVASAAAQAAAEHTLAEAVRAVDAADTARLRAVPEAAAAREVSVRLDAARHKLAAEAAALAEVLGVKDGERWPPLLDQVTVPSGLEAALGSVLGEELAAAEDPKAARHWRALPTLPLPEARGRCLANLVQAPPLLRRALGSVGLVGSDAEGEAGQAALQPGQSLVSPAGAVWRWDGYTVRAGTPSAAAVRLQQRNRLLDLRTRLADAERDAAAARTARTNAELAERDAVAAEQRLRPRRRDAEAAAERARGAARTLSAQAAAAEARLAALLDGLGQLAPEREAASAALREAQAAHAAQPDPDRLRREAETARAAVTAARTEEAAAGRSVEALQRAEGARQARAGSIGRERDDRRMRAAELTGRVKDLAARAAEAEAERERLLAAPERAARLRDQHHAEQDEAERRLLDATRASRDADQAAQEGTTAARDADHALFAARESLVRAEAARAVAETAWTLALDRVAEREGALPPLPTPTDLSPAAEEKARGRQQRLTRERDEMGPVNLRAEIEAGAIEADVALIERESEELFTAIAKLRGSIGHLNREGRERLSAVFHAVDTHFQALFSRMFGGGRAHLALVGSDDPLLTGLEIFAQPPGKKLSSLALLSGGEQALTALSLIFAVFRCNPAPLCVLDEVDAPLDDANVDRFCALLADMVEQTGTRFLVVTHHQVTMARMDRLYGVTMQERGVSRLLSVDLTRAAALLDEEPGAMAAE